MSRPRLTIGKAFGPDLRLRLRASKTSARVWSDDQLADELWHFFLAGLSHRDIEVQQQFAISVQVAGHAATEDASDSLITAALLCFPCHMLATGQFLIQPWSSDQLIESGTFDWLLEFFGEEVAEVIRLQPHCRRYLASINRGFARNLSLLQKEQLLRDGGEMSLESKFAFAKLRFFSPAMQLSRWIHQCRVHQENRIELTPAWSNGSSFRRSASSVN